MLPKAFLVLTLLSGVKGLGGVPNPFLLKRQAQSERLFEGIPEDVDLKWYPCSNDTIELKVQCARLSVPLDYKSPNNGLRAVIPIVKFAADDGVPYKGSVLMNPGGPGGLGSALIYNTDTANALRSNITGPGWDILTFDPRGIGYAVPYGSCNIIPDTFEPDRQNATTLPTTPNSKARKRAPKLPLHNDEMSYGVLLPNNPPFWKSLAYKVSDMYNSACQEYVSHYNQAGPHMNTVVVATDMLSIGKALARERNQPENTTLVNYYGVSYGTVIGQYFATLYPDNVGRFLLDGVVDAETWITGNDANTTVINADKSWSQFFTLCYNAGPTRCSFFTGRNSHAIRDRFNAITAKLNATKYELEDSTSTEFSVVYSILSTLKALLFNSLYGAWRSWPELSDFLVLTESSLASDNPADWDWETWQTAVWDYQSDGGVTYPPVASIPDSFLQVSCTDARDSRGTEFTEADEQAWKAASKLLGPANLAAKIVCLNWQIRPSWEWYGRVGGPTKTPILFAGTLGDPITPFENSEKAKKLFKGAKMYYVDEIAHTTLGTRNKCAFRHSLAYFQNGTLPGHDNRCKGEIPPFF